MVARAQRAVDTAVGVALSGADVLAAALRSPDATGPTGAAEAAPVVPPAVLGLAFAVERGTLRAAVAGVGAAAGAVQRAARHLPTLGPRRGTTPGEAVRSYLTYYHRRGIQEADRARRSAAEMARRVIPAVAMAAVRGLIDNIDIDQVLQGIDIGRLADRIDLEVIFDRMDVPHLTREVLEDIDLPGIVRESSTTITGEAVEVVRLQGMNADRALGHLVDRVLARKSERRLQGAVTETPTTEADEHGR